MAGKALVLISCDDRDKLYGPCEGIFRQNGYECARAPKDGLRVNRMIRELRPAIVIMDVFMPGCDAISVMQAIRADSALPQPLFVTISSFGNPALQHEVQKSGAAKFFCRPIHAQDMAERILAHMRAITPRAVNEI